MDAITIAEIIKAISPVKLAELVLKVRSARMGAHLILITIYLNDVVNTAEALLNQLRVFCDQNKGKKPGDEIVLDYHFPRLLREQGHNLEKLNELLERFTYEMKALDPLSFDLLREFVGGKIPILWEIYSRLEIAEFPLPWERLEGSVLAIRFDDQNHIPGGSEFGMGVLDRTLVVIDYTNVKEVLEQVRAYLEKERPHEKLEDLRTAIVKIHETIKDHFNLAEVLPHLRGIQARYNGHT